MSAQETAEAPNVTVLETLDPPKVETPEAPETPEPETPEQPAEEGQERGEDGKFKPKRSIQERFDEITREKHAAAREAAYWRGIAEGNKPKDTPQQAPEGKPVAANFESYEDFTEALAEWKLDQKLNQREQQSQERARAQTWAERAAAAKAELPDFDSVMSTSTAPMTAAMAEAIKDSDIGPKVAYHLAQNPAEAARIAQLSPTGAAREIGKLEASLSAPKPAQEKRTTQAPTPPTPLGSGRSMTGDPSKMSYPDYLVWRNSQLKESR